MGFIYQRCFPEFHKYFINETDPGCLPSFILILLEFLIRLNAKPSPSIMADISYNYVAMHLYSINKLTTVIFSV